MACGTKKIIQEDLECAPEWRGRLRCFAMVFPLSNNCRHPRVNLSCLYSNQRLVRVLLVVTIVN